MKNSKDSDIIILGGPGSGKSTQAKFVVTTLAANHLNMGKLLRQSITDKIPGYEDLSRHHDAGTLVPDEITRAMVEKFVADTPKGQRIVFDGYPRSLEQVESVDKTEASNQRTVTAIFLKLSTEVARERLLKRAEIEGRPDDTAEVIQDRIELFNTNITGILSHYREQDRLIEVNGDQDIESVKNDIADILKS